MTWVAAGVAVAGTVYSGVQGAKASRKAAEQQRQSADRGQRISEQAYGDIQGMYAPYTQAGGEGLNMLMRGLGDGVNGDLTRRFSMADFEKDPGYDFRMAEGARGVEGSAAARGGLLSGAAAKALTRYNQNFASNEYGNAYNRYSQDQGNRYNRLLGAAGIGMNATNGLANARSNAAGQAIGLNTASGNAQSAGTIGSQNALNGMMGGIGNIAMDASAIYGMQNRGGYQGGNLATNNMDWYRQRAPQPYGEE